MTPKSGALSARVVQETPSRNFPHGCLYQFKTELFNLLISVFFFFNTLSLWWHCVLNYSIQKTGSEQLLQWIRKSDQCWLVSIILRFPPPPVCTCEPSHPWVSYWKTLLLPQNGPYHCSRGQNPSRMVFRCSAGHYLQLPFLGSQCQLVYFWVVFFFFFYYLLQLWDSC